MAARLGAGSSGISLADLKSRRVLLQWFEGVAIVQELCRALAEAGLDPGQISLGARHVFIDEAGTVRFTRTAGEEHEPPIRRIGELLRTTLAESAFPVPLRLVITQALSTPPFYTSIAELSNALQYFERPDREGLVRAVYERAQRHPPVSDAVHQDAAQANTGGLAWLAGDKEPARQNTRLPRRIPRSALVASAATGTAIVLLLVVAQLPTRSPATAAAMDQLKHGTADASTRVASSLGALVNRINPFTANSAPQAAHPAPGSTKTVDVSPQRGSATGFRTRRSATRGVRADAPVERLQAPGVLPVDTLPASHATDGIPGGMLAAEPTVEDTADTATYSAVDRDVTPPVAPYPYLPAPRPADVLAGKISTLELFVGETGEVESVKLQGRPRSLGETLYATLNLSAAKTWRFFPAVKNGRPVRYRTLVHVGAVTP